MKANRGSARKPESFNEGYYRRYYLQPGTRVHDPAGRARLSRFVFAHLAYLGIPVRRVVDLGCGLGHWRRELAKAHPKARYTGVESSAYLCGKYGWESGSLADFRASSRFDLVICQSVLQYLDDDEVGAGLANLAALCRGGLYLEAVTREDWDDHCNRQVTDGRIHLRDGAWYRRRIARHFRSAGGGLFLPKDSGAVLYELEGG